jgi:hypothetical protein
MVVYMNAFAVRERNRTQQRPAAQPAARSVSRPAGINRSSKRSAGPAQYGVLQFQQNAPRRTTRKPVTTPPAARPYAPSHNHQTAHEQAAHDRVEETQRHVAEHTADQRFQHELQEMQETDDLREIDDDVEDVATLIEWHALEHTHQPKSPVWFAVLAASITVISVGFLLFGNIIAAIAIGFAGAMVYYVAQKDPATIRYRLMTEGVAFNNTLYHYRDIDSFNIVYQPGEVKTVLLRSKKHFAPLLHMEIGDADPVMIRDILIEFVREDQDLLEPLVDIWARRLGF